MFDWRQGLGMLKLDEGLITVLVKATTDGLSIAGVTPIPVGASKYLNTKHEVSAIIGFVGAICGSISINMSTTATKLLAGKMVGETFTELTPETLDGMCEVVNIIAGKTKAILSTSDLKIEKISVPSVVVGTNYYLTHYRGMQTLSVEFEMPDAQKAHQNFEHMFSVSISMMRVG